MSMFKTTVEVPALQRIINLAKVDEIVQYQDYFFKQNHTFNFIGSLNIQCVGETNYLIDGQHRFSALEKLHKQGYNNQTVIVEVMCVDTHAQLVANYELINKNTELPDFPQNIDEDVPKDVARQLQIKFPGIWKTSKRPSRPFLNFNHFQEAIGLLLDKLRRRHQKTLTAGQLMNLILDKNRKMGGWDFSRFNEIKRLKSSSKIIEKCRDNGFYLGMYPHKAQWYGYDWVRDIIRSETGSCDGPDDVVAPAPRKKKPIPPVLKEKVWELYIGDKVQELCLCCGRNTIKNTNFHCGHIVAEHCGGTLDPENLRPICKSCNTSMGVENALDYVKRNYRDNVTKFSNGIVKKGLLSHLFA